MSVEIEELGALRFVRILSGGLAIGHRPAVRALTAMRDAGVTHLVTVLSRTEGAEALGVRAKQAGLEWIWIELGSTKNLPQRRKPNVLAAVHSMTEVLSRGGRIYLHCSAGIHRTGMITAALLFHLGRDEMQTQATLSALRPLTASEVGEGRMDWARAFKQ